MKNSLSFLSSIGILIIIYGCQSAPLQAPKHSKQSPSIRENPETIVQRICNLSPVSGFESDLYMSFRMKSLRGRFPAQVKYRPEEQKRLILEVLAPFGARVFKLEALGDLAWIELSGGRQKAWNRTPWGAMPVRWLVQILSGDLPCFWGDIEMGWESDQKLFVHQEGFRMEYEFEEEPLKTQLKSIKWYKSQELLGTLSDFEWNQQKVRAFTLELPKEGIGRFQW